MARLIASLFTRNLGLKLASLVVGCAVWLWADARICTRRTVEVRLSFAPPGPAFVTRSDGTSLEAEPVVAAVTLRGRKALLDALDASQVVVSMDISGAEVGGEGEFVRSLGPENVRAPQGLAVVDVRPREVVLRRMGP
jgi:hypothetical protein